MTFRDSSKLGKFAKWKRGRVPLIDDDELQILYNFSNVKGVKDADPQINVDQDISEYDLANNRSAHIPTSGASYQSAFNYHLWKEAGTIHRGGINGPARFFDGTDDFLELKSSDGTTHDRERPPLKSTMTTCIWAKMLNLQDGTNQQVFEGMAMGGSNLREENDGNLHQYYYDGSYSQVSFSVTEDNWVFVSNVYDGTDQIVYKNTVEQGRNAKNSPTEPATGRVIIFGAAGSGTPKLNHGNCLVDSFWYFSRNLSQHELEDIYEMTKPEGHTK